MTDECRACADIMAAILAELRALRAELRPSRTTAGDREVLAALLVGWVGRFGSRPVRVRDILECPDLRRVAGDPTPGSLGGLLSRAASDRVVVVGLVVCKVPGRTGNARRWTIRRAPPGLPPTSRL